MFPLPLRKDFLYSSINPVWSLLMITSVFREKTVFLIIRYCEQGNHYKFQILTIVKTSVQAPNVNLNLK